MSVAPPVPPVGKKPHVPNKRSTLLSDQENQILFKLVGTRVQVQAAAVVQIYCTEPPNHKTWHRQHCGVATFSRDNARRSFYIQVFDIVNGEKLFEQELYQNFQYHKSKPFFHQFEGDSSVVGISFADEDEASKFYAAYAERQAARQRKREAKERSRQKQNDQINKEQKLLQGQRSVQPQAPVLQPKTGFTQHQQQPNNKNNKQSNRERRKKARVLRKDEIGLPVDFRHITHVGFDPDHGFAQFSEDEQLKTFFKLAGVNQESLDDQTREFIYDFIDKNGGIEKARQENQQYSALFSSKNNSNNNNNNNNNNNIGYGGQNKPPLPPPPPSVQQRQAAPPPSLPARNAPPPPPRTPSAHYAPPPPSGVQAPPLPPTKSSSVGGRGPPPPPGSYKTPAPPPPPPSGGGRNPPPPPPPAAAPPPKAPPAPAVLDSRSMLLDQIRSGTTLKKVEVAERPVATDGRSQLLDAIRQGTKLRPVDTDSISSSQECSGTFDEAPVATGLAGALAAALKNRAKHIQDDTDDETDDTEEEDDEWDDGD